MKPVEADERRERRYQVLVAELRRLGPDIIGIQEANPIPQYSRRLARDLGYDEIHQVYNGGIKVGPLGIPINLRMGLIILAKKNLHLRRVGARQISGDPFGIYGDFWCFHFTDSRHIMAGVASVGEKPLYIAHTHTYPGLPESREFLDILHKQRGRGRISEREYETHLSTIQCSVHRQKKEIQRILAFLETLSPVEPLILLGDFNMTEENPLMLHLLKEGKLWDTYRLANPEKNGITWDSENNQNTRYSEIPTSARSDLKTTYDRLRVEYDRECRRIDYIFVNSAFSQDQILESRVVLDQTLGGMHASDHYGVFTIVSLRPERVYR
jgi:endonuclease/exonuclease/phosphatase family metal-dependent hydrolase